MENDILDSLNDLGYQGPLTDEGAFSKALDGGPKSLEFTKLVHILAEELRTLCNLEEAVSMMNDVDESSSFLLELSSFLKELGCPYKCLVTGHMSSRLQSKEDCLLLLDYMISELMAARMVQVDCPKEKPGAGMEIVMQESPTAKDLKDILISLKFNKPPPNITAEMLFAKLESKLKDTIQKEANLVGKPLYNKALTEKDWKKLENDYIEMYEEYRLRRETLITRLDCTVQSCEWSDRLKNKKDLIQSVFRPKREALKVKPNVKLSDFLAARTSLLHVEKTSSASVRKNTQSDVNKVIIGQKKETKTSRTSQDQERLLQETEFKLNDGQNINKTCLKTIIEKLSPDSQSVRDQKYSIKLNKFNDHKKESNIGESLSKDINKFDLILPIIVLDKNNEPFDMIKCTEVRRKIEDVLKKYLFDPNLPENYDIPMFKKQPSLKHGGLKLHPEDLFSINWIRETVAGLGSLWNISAGLKVLYEKDVIEMRKIYSEESVTKFPMRQNQSKAQLKGSTTRAKQSSVQLKQSTNQLKQSSILIKESKIHLKEATIQPTESTIQLKESNIRQKESAIQLKESTMQPKSFVQSKELTMRSTESNKLLKKLVPSSLKSEKVFNEEMLNQTNKTQRKKKDKTFKKVVDEISSKEHFENNLNTQNVSTETAVLETPADHKNDLLKIPYSEQISQNETKTTENKIQNSTAPKEFLKTPKAVTKKLDPPDNTLNIVVLEKNQQPFNFSKYTQVCSKIETALKQFKLDQKRLGIRTCHSSQAIQALSMVV